jgi:hypothetical protein
VLRVHFRLTDAIVDEIIERTDGAPPFLKEVAKAIRDICRSDCDARSGVATRSLPNSHRRGVPASSITATCARWRAESNARSRTPDCSNAFIMAMIAVGDEPTRNPLIM